MPWKVGVKIKISAKYDDIEDEKSVRLTKMVMNLFNHWNLTYDEQTQVLGLSSETHSTIHCYRKETSSIRFDRDIYDRVRFLLDIHKALRTIFPLNTEMAYAWPKTPNQFFNRKTPIEIIFEEGFLGLVRIHAYLANVKTESLPYLNYKNKIGLIKSPVRTRAPCTLILENPNSPKFFKLN